MNRPQSTMNPGTVLASVRLGAGRMPPTPASPAPRTSPVIADDSLLVLAIGTQCLILARDQYLKSECKTSGTQ